MLERSQPIQPTGRERRAHNRDVPGSDDQHVNGRPMGSTEQLNSWQKGGVPVKKPKFLEFLQFLAFVACVLVIILILGTS